MITPGTPLSRNLAILVAMSPALVIGLGFGVWAATEWRAQGERLVKERALAHEYEAMTTQTRQYEAVLRSWRDYAASLDSGLIGGETSAASEAALVARVQENFERFGGVWIGAESLGAREEGGLELISLEARGEALEEEFPHFLSALETESPYVFIDAIDLKRKAAEGKTARLEVRLRLSTYRLPEDQE